MLFDKRLLGSLFLLQSIFFLLKYIDKKKTEIHMLKLLVKFLKSLNSNSHPGEIAHAISLGLLLGFLPKNNVFWYVITVFALFMRINKGALVLSTIAFTFLAPVFDPFFDKAGYWFLTLPQLEGVFAHLLDIPFVGFTKFNNTIVMGSFVSVLVLYIPVYLLTRLLVMLMRNKLIPILRKTKVIKALSSIKLIKKVMELAASKE